MTCPMRYPETCETPISCAEMDDCAIQDASLHAASQTYCPECFPWRPDARVRDRCPIHNQESS